MKRKGQVWVVGIGPGARELRTLQAEAALRAADVIIGYQGYFQWISDVVSGKACLAFALGEEEARARRALEEALSGQNVCVISSGDAGVFGMASLVVQIAEAVDEATRPEICILPGVSAVLACASLLGAPLGDDFAVISLSDLVSPWPQIERRLEAVAAADFVIVLLNPKSRQRTWQFARALDIIRRHKSRATPVGVVRNAFRPGQSIEVASLADLEAKTIDMLTTVIVGNTQTRQGQIGLYTMRASCSATK
ncbi:MAG: hypothetical protein KatS3mg105_3051 [Gemmatales bacterium]|nr:MAG: hypothetical protein KatS3mg105_3051 [Gemmatales bacterium]